MNSYLVRLLLLLSIFFTGLVHAQSEPLDPEDAFKFSARWVGDSAEIRYEIAEGYYLYREKFKFEIATGQGIVGKVVLPPGKVKQDEFFGKVETYRNKLVFKVPVDAEGNITLKVVSQGCADIGICYPPFTHEAKLVAVKKKDPLTSLNPETSSTFGNLAAGTTELGVIDGLFRSKSLLTLAGSFFVIGLLLALTPCIFPMIPILSGIIAGQGSQITRTRGILLSVSYVLGMAITYTAAGVLAGYTGQLVSTALQHPAVLSSFALIFVVLAFSMFGFYDLQLPSGLQTRLSNTSNRLPGGAMIGVFVMGALSAIIVGPCVAAPLAGALLYISQSGDAFLGGVALFFMALGMGMPLILVGASAGTLLPKAGGWMQGVKNFFGVILLGMALYVVSPLFPAVVQMLGWAGLLIVSAIYLHALDPLPVHTNGFQKFWKGVGVIALLLGVALLVGALSGGRDVLQPLSGLRVAQANAPAGQSLEFRQIRNIAELDAALAGAAGRPVMLDFYADWCVSCKEMERFTFSDERVKQRLSQAILLKADVTANTPEHQLLLKRFQLFGPPGIIFFGAQGQELPAAKVIGFQNADIFLNSLSRAFGTAS